MRWWPRRTGRMLAEVRSLRVIFFVSSMMFVVVTGWAIWNEEATRRPWKEYQAEFNRLEYQQVSQELAAERSKLDSPEARAARAKLQGDVQAAQARLAGPEYAKAQKLLAAREAEYADVSMRGQFIKSELDEALYWVEHAIYEKKDTKGPKAKVANLENKLHEITPKVEALGAKVDQAQAEVKRFRAEVEKIQAKIDELVAPVTALERRLASIKGRSPEVKQVVVEGLAINEFKEPILTVDRCTTCHLGIDRPGFEQMKQPFRTHPHREVLFGKHPITHFGCTSCHQGQGSALEVDSAHGEVKHWERPLLRGSFVQVSCRTCHVEERELPLAPVYSQGRQMVEELGCFGCHNLPGFEKLPRVGPDLTRIANKVDPSWLFRWIKEPKAYLPKTKMPNFGHSDEDVLNIAAYLLSASQPMPELRGAFKAGGSVERGRDIVSKVGCLGCHRIAGIEPKGQPSEAPSAVSPVNSGAQALESEKGAAVAVNGEQASQPVRGRLTAPPPAPENQDFAPDLSKIASKVMGEESKALPADDANAQPAPL
ncbi:MAG: hypothetical protein HW376_579 [candidate division NC10 bacterium]|nr:hypothetical protein [candidate division NC10 bacterium]